MSKTYEIIVHDVATDGLPPEDFEKTGLIGRVAFIFDGDIYSGWPVGLDDPSDPDSMIWEESEFGHKMMNVKKWIELPAPVWDL